jgi:hypothetical protein
MGCSETVDPRAEHAAKVQAGQRAIREYEAESGPLSQEERREARRFLHEVGILPTEGLPTTR